MSYLIFFAFYHLKDINLEHSNQHSWCEAFFSTKFILMFSSDPWESEMVEVRESNIPNAGQGLFAKQDLEEGTIIALFQVTSYITLEHCKLTQGF